MPTWDTSEQGTVGWLKARLGLLTASRMADAMAFTKKGVESEARRQLKYNLLAERLTDMAVDNIVTRAMEHGIENEPMARERYEEATGTIVQQCGLALHDTIPYFGASPDGLVGHDGLIEIKCPSSTKFIKWKLEGIVPEEHRPQMLAQLAVTQRRFVDFVAFDPRFPEALQLWVMRYEPTPDEIKATEDSAQAFLEELEAMFDVLVTT